MTFEENYLEAADLWKGWIVSLPSTLRCRKTKQSTRALQPDFPKDGSAAHQHSSARGTHMSMVSGQSRTHSPFPGVCHAWLIALGGCQPEAVDTAGLTTLFLPHPTSLPRVYMGAEGIQQTRNLCEDFFAGRGKITFPASKPFRWK